MLATIIKMILMALAEDAVKTVIKGVVKDKITSKTDTTFDDGLIDVIFDSKSTNDLSRNVIGYGANKLIESVDDGIRNADITKFLDTATKSSTNNMNKTFKEGISNSLDANERRESK